MNDYKVKVTHIQLIKLASLKLLLKPRNLSAGKKYALRSVSARALAKMLYCTRPRCATAFGATFAVAAAFPNNFHANW